MKIIAIGDIHGRDIWKEIVKKEIDADKIIFMGDYLDSFEVDRTTQLKNFSEIVEFKKQYPDKVVLLYGNHDHHYVPDTDESYSGFDYTIKEKVKESFEYLISVTAIQLAYSYEGYLFTHAGVSKTWLKSIGIENELSVNVEQILNDKLLDYPELFNFTPSSPEDNYGNSITQSPIWIRPQALDSDRIEGFRQVVGHTHQKNIDINSDTIYIDTFDNCREYLIINNLVPSVGRIE